LLFNARGVCNKLEYLSFNLNKCFAPIVLVTETWLTASTPDCFLSFSGCYNVFRKDRINSICGGVMALVCTNLSVCIVEIPEVYTLLELLCFDVFLPCLTVRFVVCYRPPYYDANASDYLSELLECLELLVAHKNPTVIVGDFMFPKFDWVNMSTKCDEFDKVFFTFCCS